MQVEWRLAAAQVRALAVLAVVALAAGAVWWWMSAPVAETAVRPVRVATVPTADAVVIVDVVGAVRNPGVVRLPAGARVVDAVAAAGGVLPGRVPRINLARRLVDGEQLVVGRAVATQAAEQGSGGAGGGRLDLNTATVAQLDALPGIGPVLAQRISDYRRQHGPFADVRGLLQVSGIGDAKFADLADAVTV